MRLALLEPDIPHNTGSLIRLAVCLGFGLDLIGPCGFLVDDKRLRRVAMDYADRARICIWSGWTAFRDDSPRKRLIAVEAGVGAPYTEIGYTPEDVLLFGSETAGLPPWALDAAALAVHIPMAPGNRSLNLATAAAMVAGEARRQCPAPRYDAPGPADEEECKTG